MRWSGTQDSGALGAYQWHVTAYRLRPLLASMLRSTAERYAKRARVRMVRRADVEAAWREIQAELRRPGDGEASA